MKAIIEGVLLGVMLIGVVGGVWSRVGQGKGIDTELMTGAIAATAVGAVLARLGKDTKTP